MNKLLMAFICCVAVVAAQTTIQETQGSEQCPDGQIERIILVENSQVLQKGDKVTLDFYINGDPNVSPYENYVASEGRASRKINGVYKSPYSGALPTSGWRQITCNDGEINGQEGKGHSCGEEWRDLLQEGDNVVEFTAAEEVTSVAVAAFYCPYSSTEEVPEFGPIVAVTTAGAAALAVLFKRRRRRESNEP